MSRLPRVFSGLWLPWLWLFAWFGAAIALSGTGGAHQLEHALAPPSLLHPFGFDAFGRDMLSTVLRASAASAIFALVALAVSSTLGIVLGTSIALAPERPRFAALRALELFLAFPSLLIALAWAAVRGPGWDTLIVSLAIGILPSFTRLLYARTTELLAEEYVLAARSLGATQTGIARKHLAPALLSLCSVKTPGLFAHALLAEATLSFLGVGAPIGRDTWGALLSQGRDYLIEAPHLAMGAGLPLVLTVLSLQLVSERMSRRIA